MENPDLMATKKPKTTVPAKPKGKTVSTEFLLLFYDACIREKSPIAVAKILDISKTTLVAWVKKFPVLRTARAIADNKRETAYTFSDYIHKHLSEEAQSIWDDIKFWDDADNATSKVRAILEGKTKRIRQELFIHALVDRGFDLSKACHLIGVSRLTLEQWKNRDFEFLQLLEELEWHKCNFFESALVDLVADGNPAAVLFVNRTKNASRGYNEKLLIEHGGSIGVTFNIEELNLSIECRKELLGAIREQKKAVQLAEENSKAIDVKSIPPGS